MDINAQLAVAKQAFDELLRLCEPNAIADWRPTPEQRSRYVALAEQALDGLDWLQVDERKSLIAEGRLHHFVPASLLAFVREKIEPSAHALHAALEFLDPEGKEYRDLWAKLRSAPFSGVRRTFEEGLNQVEDLIERNDWDFDHPFSPASAWDVFESKLIQFDPDAWLNRAKELAPVRTHRTNFDLPGHVRLRLTELYRVYIFGCWLSVFGLCRAILEYAILDNLAKFGVEASWPPEPDGTRRTRKLSHLIDDVAERLPDQREAMTRLREWGNEYLHPKTSRVSKEALFERETAAKLAVETLVDVVEAIYLAPRRP